MVVRDKRNNDQWFDELLNELRKKKFEEGSE